MAKETTGKTSNVKARSSRRKTGQVNTLKAGSRSTAKSSKGNSTCLAQAPVLTQELIAKRAKKIWQDRGCIPGFDEQNWHEAERPLKAELEIH